MQRVLNKKILLAEIEKEILRREAKENFWSFCLYMNGEWFTKRKDVLKPVANEIQVAYEKAEATGHYKLNISMPPRTGKSTLINHFIAWSIGKDASRSIVRASYSFDLTSELNEQAKMLIDSIDYGELFNINIVENNAKTLRVKDTHRASLYATSVGGGVTGFGGEITIADDLYKDHIEALSEVINKKTKEWYMSAFRSRLDGKRRLEIIIGTRWRVDELVDELEKKDYFDKVIKVKALINDKSYCEEIHTTKSLLEMRNTMHPSIFNSEYQQEPMLAKGGLIQPTDFIRVNDVEDVIYRMALVDNKTTGKDYYAVPIIAITDDNEYILEDVIYTQEPISDELEERAATILNAYGVNEIFFETNKDYSHYRNMRKLLMGRAKPFTTKLNKEVKILTYSKLLKGISIVITKDKEYNAFIRDIYKYDLESKNDTDDAIDSLVMLMMRVVKKFERSY